MNKTPTQHTFVDYDPAQHTRPMPPSNCAVCWQPRTAHTPQVRFMMKFIDGAKTAYDYLDEEPIGRIYGVLGDFFNPFPVSGWKEITETEGGPVATALKALLETPGIIAPEWAKIY
jgi:hypothetical protein